MEKVKLTLTEIIEAITDLLIGNSNFKKVTIEGNKTSIVIEKDEINGNINTKELD